MYILIPWNKAVSRKGVGTAQHMAKVLAFKINEIN